MAADLHRQKDAASSAALESILGETRLDKIKKVTGADNAVDGIEHLLGAGQ